MSEQAFPALHRGVRRLLVAAAAMLLLATLAIAYVSGHEILTPVRLVQAGLPLLLALACLAASRARLEVGLSVLAVLVSSVLFALLAEAWLSRPEVRNPSIADARRAGKTDFDVLTPAEVMRSSPGLRIPVHPEEFYGKEPAGRNGSPLLPFGSIPSADVLLCNESGRHLVLRTDEAGFANPPGSWSQPAPMDIMLIGDSYAEGWCVPDSATIAGRIRTMGRTVINLGRGGMGSLAEMAVLREYLPLFRPKLVVWTYFENDFGNIMDELASPVLRRYLDDPAFTQNLANRRDEANQITAQWEEQARHRLLRRGRLPFPGIRHFVNTQAFFLSSASSLSAEEDWSEAERVFRVALADARSRVEASGGKLLFVYLGDLKKQRVATAWNAAGRQHDRVMDIIRELGIEAIDTRTEAALLPDPALMHNFGTSGHYTAEGYGIVLAPLFRRLEGSP